METALPLRHLAVVADRVAGWGGDPADELAASLAKAVAVAGEALATLPDAAVVSFFSPDLRDRLLAGPAGGARETCARFLDDLAADAARRGAAVRVLGRADRLPPGFRPAPPAGGPAGRVVAVFLDYSSRDEILRAAGAVIRAAPGAAVAEESLGDRLDTAGLPDPDLVLAVGGAFEPHDFLLWQASYAELWHTPSPWRDFTVGDLAGAVADYRTRQRRFGR